MQPLEQAGGRRRERAPGRAAARRGTGSGSAGDAGARGPSCRAGGKAPGTGWAGWLPPRSRRRHPDAHGGGTGARPGHDAARCVRGRGCAAAHGVDAVPMLLVTSNRFRSGLADVRQRRSPSRACASSTSATPVVREGGCRRCAAGRDGRVQARVLRHGRAGVPGGAGRRRARATQPGRLPPQRPARAQDLPAVPGSAAARPRPPRRWTGCRSRSPRRAGSSCTPTIAAGRYGPDLLCRHAPCVLGEASVVRQLNPRAEPHAMRRRDRGPQDLELRLVSRSDLADPVTADAAEADASGAASGSAGGSSRPQVVARPARPRGPNCDAAVAERPA